MIRMVDALPSEYHSDFSGEVNGVVVIMVERRLEKQVEEEEDNSLKNARRLKGIVLLSTLNFL